MQPVLQQNAATSQLNGHAIFFVLGRLLSPASRSVTAKASALRAGRRRQHVSGPALHRGGQAVVTRFGACIAQDTATPLLKPCPVR